MTIKNFNAFDNKNDERNGKVFYLKQQKSISKKYNFLKFIKKIKINKNNNTNSTCEYKYIIFFTRIFYFILFCWVYSLIKIKKTFNERKNNNDNKRVNSVTFEFFLFIAFVVFVVVKKKIKTTKNKEIITKVCVWVCKFRRSNDG